MASCIGEIDHNKSWYGSIPDQTSHNQKISGNWSHVTLIQRNKNGNWISDGEIPHKFEFILQRNTKDLYGLKPHEDSEKDFETPDLIAKKALGMLLGLPFYMIAIMIANFIKIFIDATSFFWKVLPKIKSNFQEEGIICAMGNVFISTVWEIPDAVASDVWRIVRSPIYAIGMLFASLYTIVRPYPGRTWLGRIERQWHEGTTYKDDIRHKKTCDELEEVLLDKRIFSEIARGKICFLGYCMDKRGNLLDKINGKSRFDFFHEKNPKRKENPFWKKLIQKFF